MRLSDIRVVLPGVSYFAQSIDYKCLAVGPLLQSIASKQVIGKVLKTKNYFAFGPSGSADTSIAVGGSGIGRRMLLICFGLGRLLG